MKLHIIISNEDSWKVNWDKFTLPTNDCCILIADKFSCDKIINSDKKIFFSEIVCCNNFSFNLLETLVDSIFFKRKYDNSQTNIVTVNEENLLVCAQLREYFNLPGDKIEDIERFVDKSIMKKWLENDNQIKEYLPKYRVFERDIFEKEGKKYISELIEHLKFPIFIKPTSECDSKGVQKVDNEKALQEWISRKLYTNSNYEFDEYIEGDLFHCDSIIQNGEIIYSIVSKYLHPCAEIKLQNKWHGSMVLHESDKIKHEILIFNRNVITSLSPKGDCVTHHECFITKSGKIVFLEIAKRVAGSCIVDMYDAYNKLNLIEIDYKLRLNIPYILKEEKSSYCARIEIPSYFDTKLLNRRIKSDLFILYIDNNDKNNLKILISNNNYQELLEDFQKIKLYSDNNNQINSLKFYKHRLFVAREKQKSEYFCINSNYSNKDDYPIIVSKF